MSPWDGVRRLAVVGVAKNCGKTTTLNLLVADATRDGRTVGLASIGVDGERQDALLGTPKPPVWVPEGTWIASAASALSTATCDLEYHQELGFETPLGRVVIARALTEGEVVLAGLRHRADMHFVAEALESHGVDLVMLDGAYGRIVAASPALTDAVVVSTGAVVGKEVEHIVRATASLMDCLQLPPLTEGWHRELMEESLETQSVRWAVQKKDAESGEGSFQFGGAEGSALLGLEDVFSEIPEGVVSFAIPGAITDGVVDEFLAFGPPSGTLLVSDGTVLHCDSRRLSRLRKSWDLRVKNLITVLGLSFNPQSPQGWSVESKELEAALRSRWPKTPIFDPHVGLESSKSD